MHSTAAHPSHARTLTQSDYSVIGISCSDIMRCSTPIPHQHGLILQNVRNTNSMSPSHVADVRIPYPISASHHLAKMNTHFSPLLLVAIFSFAARAAPTPHGRPEITTNCQAKEAIEEQFSLEILLKHDELRLINQELLSARLH